MFLSVAAPRLVIDPFDSTLTAINGAVTFEDAGRATNRKGENWRQAATARFVPRDPDDIDAYDAVYGWCFDHFPRYVWLNEAADVLPARGYPRMGRRYIAQGAKRSCGHLAESQRPREILRSLIANAGHVIVFALPNAEDVRHVADNIGVPFAELARELEQLPEHGFVWRDVERRTTTACDPLRLR
jgi:hypothetical protein